MFHLMFQGFYFANHYEHPSASEKIVYYTRSVFPIMVSITLSLWWHARDKPCLMPFDVQEYGNCDILSSSFVIHTSKKKSVTLSTIHPEWKIDRFGCNKFCVSLHHCIHSLIIFSTSLELQLVRLIGLNDSRATGSFWDGTIGGLCAEV